MTYLSLMPAAINPSPAQRRTPQFASIPAVRTMGGVRFGSEGGLESQKSLKERANDWFKMPKFLKEWRNLAEWVMTGLFKLLPNSFFRWVERKTLYVGSNLEDSKITLSELRERAVTLPADEQAIINKIEEERIDPDGLNSLSWYCPANKGQPTILVSMGNTGSLKDMTDYYKPLLDKGYGMLMYEYPGYGSTGGEPDQKTVVQSAINACKYLIDTKKMDPSSQIVSYGISLGGAVSTEMVRQLANEEIRLKAVVLESTMTTFAEVTQNAIAKWLQPWLFPLHKFIQSHFNSSEKVKDFDQPTLIMHGDSDPLMDKSMALELQENTGQNLPEEKKSLKEFVLLAGGHNLSAEKTSAAIDRFLSKLKLPNYDAESAEHLGLA